MNDDVRKYIYGTVIVFLTGLLLWVGFIYVNACGFTFTCNRGALPADRTPIPTLIPATLPAAQLESSELLVESDLCYVSTADLFSAWVAAGSSQEETFTFTDANGRECETSFEEVKPHFEKQSNEMVFVGKPLP
jgi:hypothetical protein